MAINQPENAHRLFAEIFNTGDVKALLALYEPGAKLITEPGQVAEGLEAIKDALAHFLSLGNTITLETQYVIQAGDIALLRARWQLTRNASEGETRVMQGNSEEVIRRQADGSWLYIIDHPFGAD